MEIKMYEYGHCFHFSLKPETMEDQALLVRFGMNATNELSNFNVFVGKDGLMSGYINIKERSRKLDYIKGKSI